ncbi:BadF/BadG/BcrA/BcrD ATPase family protein [Amaricoccus sp.]|uniref:BadF/BadG/BcrA/BcrD ATPase family protein n=1 Tax=Amaricoccus sp. TaxID=1872485 RepID=UPI00261CFDCF|nr:BadF/BadG/BcrA/BcrD ATPase family protein [Amaricoccus sp.]HRO12300.1 BadF/BadG/BcrA/BcrD ATPase family protein [Amaricoccus sp.]
MELFLGMDGGGSGCRAAVADRQGRILGRGEGGAANIWSHPEGALASILATAGAAAAAAGVDPARLDAVLGLAGANMADARARLAGRLPFASVRIETDAVVALKGALGAADGIAATLGTGSVFGLQRGGAVRILGGWGFLLGDQGGGARLGRALLEAALLAHDGLAETTPLLAAVLAAHGGPEGIVAFGRRAAPADFAAEVPRLLAAEAAGDPAARAILREAEAAVAASIDRLGAAPLPVCFLGGLGPEFARRLAPRYPGRIRPPLGSGLDGALAMARGTA